MARLSLIATIGCDLARYRGFRRPEGEQALSWRVVFETFVFKAGFQAVILHRFSHALFAQGWIWAAWAVMRLNQFVTGAEIEFGAEIASGLLIAHPNGVVIGRGTVIGSEATIFQGVTCGVRGWTGGMGSEYPRIGDGVVLCARCSVLGGVRIGDRVIVGAHALVTESIASNERRRAS